MSLLSKIRQAAMLRHFRPRLVVPAARTMMARKSWQKVLKSECEWQELFARGRYSEGGSVVDAAHLWWGAFKARRTYITIISNSDHGRAKAHCWQPGCFRRHR